MGKGFGDGMGGRKWLPSGIGSLQVWWACWRSGVGCPQNLHLISPLANGAGPSRADRHDNTGIHQNGVEPLNVLGPHGADDHWSQPSG